MCDIRNEIKDRLKSLTIDCPACSDFYGDDQYTCTECWCEGGQGKIHIISYLKDNPNLINELKIWT